MIATQFVDEAAGEVVECGPGVNDLHKGDHVVMVFAPSCGECISCKEGHPGRCEPGQLANGAGKLLGDNIRLSKDGGPVYHHVGVSAFAEYAVVNRGSLVKIDKEQASFFRKAYGRKDAPAGEFDLVINCDHLSRPKLAADLVARAFRNKFGDELKE